MAEDTQQGEKMGISIPLIIVIVLVIGGGLYLYKKGGMEVVEPTVEIATTTPVAAELPVAADRAAKILAGGLGAPVETIKIIDAVERQWPDGCLGLAKPEEMCTQAIVPGYLIHLEAQSVTYAYRADKAGNQIRADRTGTK